MVLVHQNEFSHQEGIQLSRCSHWKPFLCLAIIRIKVTIKVTKMFFGDYIMNNNCFSIKYKLIIMVKINKKNKEIKGEGKRGQQITTYCTK